MFFLGAEHELRLARELDKVADEVGRSSGQVALNWLRQQPGTMLPIVGATRVPQLGDGLGCLEFQLSESHMKRLSELGRVELGFPHNFLQSDDVRELIFGGTFQSIGNPKGSLYT